MKYLTFILAFFLSMQIGYSQKYWEQSNISSNFDLTKNYKVAILPINSTNPSLLKLADLAYNSITSELMACSKFQLLNKNLVQQAVNKFSFGISGLDASSYAELAKDLNVDILVLCDLSADKQTIKKKEIGTVMAFVQFLDMKNNANVLYIGKARAINPLSAEAELELAIQKALSKFIKQAK